MIKTPTTKEALNEAIKLIDFFIQCAKDNEVPVVSLGTFRTLTTMRAVAK